MQVETSRESLDALKRAAEAAMAFTAETWRASPNAFGVLNTVDMGAPPTSPFIVVHSDCGGHGAVTAFIVAAQPSAVMALLAERDAATARAEAAERERDELLHAGDNVAIARGMGWDMDGVLDALEDALTSAKEPSA